MRIESEIKIGFKDVLIRPKRSTLQSRSEVDLERVFKFRHSSYIWKGIPIIAANMSTTGTFEMCISLHKHHMLTAIHKHYSLEEWEKFLSQAEDSLYDHMIVSSGIREEDLQKLDALLKQFPKIKIICLDVANGYSERFINTVKSVRQKYPHLVIIAGNVVTVEMVEQLILSGADVVKVGIGPGSVCTTRIKTGVGYPQLSAIIECADAAHGLGGLIISDGGCTSPGDVSKAFGAGGDFVMLGGMLAAHKESGGNIVEKDGQTFVEFYGMSSEHAMKKFHGKVDEYRSAEGKFVLLPYRGSVEDTVLDILGGVRSTCTYVGAKSLKELSKRTSFIRVAEQANEIFH